MLILEFRLLGEIASISQPLPRKPAPPAVAFGTSFILVKLLRLLHHIIQQSAFVHKPVNRSN